MRALAPVAVEQFVGGRPNRAAVLRERSGCLVACEAHPDELLESIKSIESIEIIKIIEIIEIIESIESIEIIAIIKREHLESSRSLSGPSEAALGIPVRRPFPRSPARPS